jgi:TatD DNase family protein
MAERVLDLGFKLSFTGTVTFKKDMLSHKVIKYAGLENILIETDSPYLTPIPFRGKRNEPCHTVLVARTIAEILQVPLETVAETTVKNTVELFNKIK